MISERPVRAPSMIDVARRAGVSHQTVSRALNSPEALRSDTLARVQRAMRELGYRRNSQARALKTRRTGLIGVVSPGDVSFGPNRMTLAIEQACRERGFATALSVVRDAQQQTVESTLDFFLGYGIEAVVVIAPIPTVADAAKQLSRRMPVVMVTSGLSPAEEQNVVGIDQQMGARLAVQHLVELGHRRIAHLAGPGDWYDARGRIAGWQEVLIESGLDPTLRVSSPGWGAEHGYQAAQQLLDQDAALDAVFVSNDYMALGAVRAMEDAGLRVPEDISVVGFDDVDAAAYFAPALTTVRQPFEAAGRSAIDVLLRTAAGEHPGMDFIVPELRVRSSTRAR
ncbi:LacI family DNA-binding transcriptional regulator [Nesterenkonia alkaliphila]|uniref:Substrate-binding domain-containing protein n=1 Tax=Nesterenkonia alkaliphila TaxID=1463631 RepID=A0A7K1UE92_9MICC|nr:LacI family DNA-binding transcriptional regulator [Nesterenkonia alkaliphila]MVT24800.1 substrate-binding domain-containing protein [Nesterenkonia alkaliphila]GFZ93434.1 transcriptional regulator [Nesterenkonia alkaliphila]